MRIITFLCLLTFITVFAASQDQGNLSRGSIPEVLLRPNMGEASRYPFDTVIGELGQGRASSAAYSFASSVASALVSGQTGSHVFDSVTPDLRDRYLSSVRSITPRTYRLGGGREEADGAVSFLVRFIGRDNGIVGELYIRYVTRQIEGDDGELTEVSNWIFEELLLEEARSLDVQRQEAASHLDLLPYERFF